MRNDWFKDMASKECFAAAHEWLHAQSKHFQKRQFSNKMQQLAEDNVKFAQKSFIEMLNFAQDIATTTSVEQAIAKQVECIQNVTGNFLEHCKNAAGTWFEIMTAQRECASDAYASAGHEARNNSCCG